MWVYGRMDLLNNSLSLNNIIMKNFILFVIIASTSLLASCSRDLPILQNKETACQQYNKDMNLWWNDGIPVNIESKYDESTDQCIFHYIHSIGGPGSNDFWATSFDAVRYHFESGEGDTKTQQQKLQDKFNSTSASKTK